MFNFVLTSKLARKVNKIKDKTLAKVFRNKIHEIISKEQDYKTIKDYNRVNITENYNLIFKIEENLITFIDIMKLK